MAEIRLTKNELRNQQVHLAQLEKYLPTLQLKKAMLQAVVQEVRLEIQKVEDELEQSRKQVDLFSPLLSMKNTINLKQAVKVKEVTKYYENVAGVDVPFFKAVDFEEFTYHLFETPPWVDAAIIELRNLAGRREQIKVLYEQQKALEEEWREVSIRVNLFEKILIPCSF